MARPPGGNRVIVGVLLVAIAALSACSSPPKSVAPANLDIVCEGEGSPTVILVPGMQTPAATFESLQEQLAFDTLVCSYSRAGLGGSPAWPEDAPDPSAGMMADQLRATLESQKIPGPYVVLGWSWGGLVTQAFAARHGDVTAGVVLEDSSSIEHFALFPDGWEEGGRTFDLDATYDEVEGLDLGDRPLIVLTRGLGEESELPLWTSAQERLATASDNAIHVIAVDAGHEIHWMSEALVEKAVDDVVRAVRDGEPLGPCDEFEWPEYGGECHAPQ